MTRRLALLLCLVLALPLIGILGAWLTPEARSWQLLRDQATTVLPGYALSSAALALGVAIGVALLGGATAAAVTLFDFPGRRHFEWALLLPLAMPAYVLAYAATDFLQFSGPAQTTLRELTGLSGALWPDVRSLPGAIVLFTLALYPYVYLLTRGALLERGLHLMEAAQLLGVGLRKRVFTVALPLARPALAAGVALALMETLADYGVGSYFGLNTFTTGIYKAWLAMDDRIAAAQLATVLLATVALLLWAERRAQARMRYASSRGNAGVRESRPVVLNPRSATFAVLLCALPIVLGFVLPVAVLLHAVWREAAHGEFGLPWARFAGWSWTSVKLATLAAAAAVAVAMWLGFVLRGSSAGAARPLARLVSLGYAVPGSVIAVGLLLPVGWVQSAAPGTALASGVTVAATGSIFGLLYAYLVRFSGVALQSVEAGYARIPASFDDTARTLGAGAGRLFREVHAPLLLRSALAAGLLVFVDVMKELPATLVLRPFNSDTLAVIAYQMARDERLAEAALPSLAIVAVGLIPVVLLSRAMRGR